MKKIVEKIAPFALMLAPAAALVVVSAFVYVAFISPLKQTSHEGRLTASGKINFFFEDPSREQAPICKIVASNSLAEYITYSDSSGYFDLQKLEYGEYNITITAPDFVTIQTTYHAIKAFDGYNNIGNFEMYQVPNTKVVDLSVLPLGTEGLIKITGKISSTHEMRQTKTAQFRLFWAHDPNVSPFNYSGSACVTLKESPFDTSNDNQPIAFNVVINSNSKDLNIIVSPDENLTEELPSVNRSTNIDENLYIVAYGSYPISRTGATVSPDLQPNYFAFIDHNAEAKTLLGR